MFTMFRVIASQVTITNQIVNAFKDLHMIRETLCSISRFKPNPLEEDLLYDSHGEQLQCAMMVALFFDRSNCHFYSRFAIVHWVDHQIKLESRVSSLSLMRRWRTQEISRNTNAIAYNVCAKFESNFHSLFTTGFGNAWLSLSNMIATSRNDDNIMGKFEEKAMDLIFFQQLQTHFASSIAEYSTSFVPIKFVSEHLIKLLFPIPVINLSNQNTIP